jgi:hypothetical protein
MELGSGELCTIVVVGAVRMAYALMVASDSVTTRSLTLSTRATPQQDVGQVDQEGEGVLQARRFARSVLGTAGARLVPQEPVRIECDSGGHYCSATARERCCACAVAEAHPIGPEADRRVDGQCITGGTDRPCCPCSTEGKHATRVIRL